MEKFRQIKTELYRKANVFLDKYTLEYRVLVIVALVYLYYIHVACTK